MKRSQPLSGQARPQKSHKEAPEPHRLQEQPPEGDRDTIERELRRQPSNEEQK
jgi:hypothetical protein